MPSRACVKIKDNMLGDSGMYVNNLSRQDVIVKWLRL